MNKLDVLKLKSDIHLLQQKIEDGEKDLKRQEENETVLENELPIHYAGYSSCFRK